MIFSTLFSLISLTSNPAQAEELNGEFIGQFALPASITASVGLPVGGILAVTSGFSCSAEHVDPDCGDAVELGIGMAVGGLAAGVAGTTMGFVGNQRMISDLKSRGIEVDNGAYRWAQGLTTLSAVALATPLIIGPETLFENDPIYFYGLSTAAYIMANVMLEQQRRTSKAALNHSKAQGKRSSLGSHFSVGLSPTPTGMALGGTF